MKKLLITAFAATAFCAFAEEKAAPAPADTAKADGEAIEEVDDSGSGLWGEASVDILSDYMWRGIILDDNPVWQPSVSLGYNTEDFGGIYFNYWASFDLTDRRNRMPYGNNSRQCGSIQEQDFYVGYTKSFGDVDFEIGHYWYDYPYNGKRGTTGVNDPSSHNAGSLGSDLTAGVFYNNPYITPGAEVLWNYSTMHGKDPSRVYFRFSVKHDFEITDTVKLTPKSVLGVGDHEFTRSQIAGVMDDSRDNYGVEMTDWTQTLALSWAVTDYFTLGAKINYTWVPSHSLRHERWMTGGHDNRNQLVWGGVNAALSF